jgi:hypothetical protein
MALIPGDSNSPYISFDGEVIMRIADKDSCYLNAMGRCMGPEMMPEAYQQAMSKSAFVTNEQGVVEQVGGFGIISLDTGHAPMGVTDPRMIAAWYDGGQGPLKKSTDDAKSAMFFGRYHVMPDGIWFKGSVSPHRDTLDCIVAASSAPSAEWVRLDGQPYRTLLGTCMVASEAFRKGIKSHRIQASFVPDSPGVYGDDDRIIWHGPAKRIQAGFGLYACTSCAEAAWNERLQAAAITLANSTPSSYWVQWGRNSHGYILAVLDRTETPTVKIQPYLLDEKTGEYSAVGEPVEVAAAALSEWRDMAETRVQSNFANTQNVVSAVVNGDLTVPVDTAVDKVSWDMFAEVLIGGVSAQYWYPAEATDSAGNQLHQVTFMAGDNAGERAFVTEAEMIKTGKTWSFQYLKTSDVIAGIQDGSIESDVTLSDQQSAALLAAAVLAEDMATSLDLATSVAYEIVDTAY